MFDLIKIFGTEEADSASGIAALGFDAKAFIIQLITFLIVLFVLKKYVFGRVVELLEKRRETIEKGVELTSEMVAQKEKLDKEVEKILANAREEANEVLSRTQDQANIMIKDAEETAKAKVDNMIKEAKVKIDDETSKAMRKLEKEIVDIIVEAIEIVTSEKLDAKKDAVLLAKALKGKV